MQIKIDEKTLTVLQSLPTLPQRQDSLVEQLHDLVLIAIKLGMHDAADFIVKGENES